MEFDAQSRMGMLKENKSSTQKSSKSLPVLHEVEIIYQGPKLPLPVRITNSNECFNVLQELYDKRKIDYKEMFFVLLLNKANYCLGASKIGLGSTSGVQVNVKEIFQLALKMNASGIVLSHNHPSGNLSPSDADKRLTMNVKSACDCLEITLLDHIIITSNGYYSFNDDGLM